jgi:uncharacterized protein (TIGR03663 family)
MNTKEKESVLDNSLTWKESDYFICLVIICLGVVLRFLHLDAKPYHHDEAIFGMYAFYHYDNPATGFYKYIPMLNGPLLFHLQALLFKFFGASDYVGRLIPAFLGSVFILIPLYFKKSLNKNLLLFFVALMSFSPLFLYYSRFLRHEFLVISCYCLFLYFLLLDKSVLKFAAIPFLFWLHWCIKENVYVFVAIFLGFIFFDFIVQKTQRSKSFIAQYFPLNGSQKWSYFVPGFLLGLLVFYLLYSNFGVFNKGFTDGLYKESFTYWLNQHKIERIKGPFSIHFLMLNWYELMGFLTIVAAFCFQVKSYYSKQQKLLLFNVIFSLAVISFVFSESLLKMDFLYSFLKLKISLDLFLCFFLLFIAVYHTLILQLKKLQIHSFLFYLFIAHFFTYSYLGEKVPWLALYPLFFGLIYACHVFYYEATWEKFLDWRVNNTLKASTYLLILVSLFNLYSGIRTSFIRAANIEEFIIQVHPVDEYKNTLQNIMETTERKKSSQQTSVLLLDDSTWITTWYFKEMKYNVQFDKMAKPLESHDIILSKDPNLAVLDTHNKVEIDYSGWWVPDYKLMNLVSFYHYAITHKAWNVSGLMKYYVYSKKGFYEP